ncbi:MAG: 2-amino-4-hydroxy-6-hydroxymethyldihydropteridine diphosphokinase [Pseudomonadota bacterium]
MLTTTALGKMMMCQHRSRASKVLIALGANLPSDNRTPRQTIAAALAALPQNGLELVSVSSIYANPAFPLGSGPDFVNACAVLQAQGPEVGPEPEAVLAALHAVEVSLGRERRDRWGPRVCDLDLLAIGDRVAPDRETLAQWMGLSVAAAQTRAPADLILPHPRLHERAFVLAPLAEVAPDWRHPLLDRTVSEMLAALPASAMEGLVRDGDAAGVS